MQINGADFHLIFNHFPLIVLLFSLGTLGVGVLRKSQELTRTGLLFAVLAGIFAVVTYLTGEPAEDVLKAQQSFSSRDQIHTHEQAALFALGWLCLTGILAAVGLYYSIKKKRAPRILLGVILFLQLFSLTVVGRTNYLGGRITHVEIR